MGRVSPLVLLACLFCSVASGDDLSRYNILQKVKPSDVVWEPYPYLKVHDVLPADLYNELAEAYPTAQELVNIARGRQSAKMNNNVRYNIMAMKTLRRETKLPQIWKEFVEYHVSDAFYQEIVRVFGGAISNERSDVERTRGKKLQEMGIVTRGLKNTDADLRVDCQIAMNSPVTRPSKFSVRGPHHDMKIEVWAGLLYMREKKDKSTGGALNVYSCKSGKCQELSQAEKHVRGIPEKKNHVQFDEADLELEATVPYKENTLAWFVNTPHSVHGVTPRSVTPYPRRLVNFIGELIGRKRG
uniref:Prolyl 4-hydroxylase alpha subunit Fe(2+) 2OG dioxygenase domain-containing protein n=1 Tax=Pyramimonas obovata TaxID=1411642 RepID=A0A7S0RC11_9CHLO|mmetsp:Transcript_30667/g.66953  ORF Transcript_30667/g.66953 Transcript_30667/m.66953 type:complete len:300 (+) Transcript_30667:174-1073(+)|eukprot:CAMPEP_0118932574 /NCGR_PEP_ID=MMETSP1169-20130426/10502_1 /TAXON_ID=36882 /ORGANISM="Pyramimonas obovata, Strain CCMP722" /LENGTH=299 /DNA_ID=CAMNT_0006875251 /DNA_START=131 /DNA_END=1030 /DNA_ORIENTATION=+